MKTKKLVFIPVTVFCLVCVVLFVDVLILYNRPRYGKGENPRNIKLETYLAGKNQPTHPSVLDFGKEWNGWRYWMSYSPYPYRNGEEENPCIAVSNDMNVWGVPNGLYNPIAFNEETGCDELKDPHIVYNYHTDSLEVWYLGRINGTRASKSDLLMMRKKSVDGIDWSRYEVLDTVNGMLSPSIIYEDGIYKRWFIKPSTDSTSGKLLYSESKNAKEWTADQGCIFGDNSEIQKIWHGAVANCEHVYCFVFIETSRSGDKIMYSESKDGLHWSKPSCIISKGTMRYQFYRPCIMSANDSIYCLYGTVDHNNIWKVAMSAYSREEFPEHNYAHSDSFSEFYVYIIGEVKRVLHAVSVLKLIIIAFVLSLILSFVSQLKKYKLIWPMTWIVLILYGISGFVGIFQTCIYVLITGIISLFSSLALLGARTLIK